MTDNPQRQNHHAAGPEQSDGFESLLAAAVRSVTQQDGPGAEERAVAAFREALDHGSRSTRMRRRDNWRPRRRGLARWSLRTTMGTLVAGVALGGVAVAGIGAVKDGSGQDTDQRRLPGRSASGFSSRPTPDQARPSVAAPSPSHTPGRLHSPGPPPGPPEPAGDTLAKCHAYASVRGRGEALDSPAWRRFLAAAGGEASVDAYCAAERAREESSGSDSGHGNSSGTHSTAAQGKANGHQNGAASPKPSKTKNPGRGSTVKAPGAGSESR